MKRAFKSSLKKDHDNLRLNFVIACFFIAFLVISVRLFKIQVLDHEKFKAMALGQYMDSQELISERGDIISSDGFILAGTKSNYLMFLEPNVIADKYEISHKLAEAVSAIKFERLSKETLANESEETTASSSKKLSQEEIFNELYEKYFNLVNQDLMWVAAERGLSPLDKEKLQELEIKGVGFDEEPTRFYPENSLGAHVLGFIASDEKGEKTGYFGIEGSLNEDLRGKNGRVIQERDAVGIPILMGGYRKVDPAEGRDVKLTLNKSIQFMVEKKLEEGVKKYDAVSGTVIVMNPSTGEVIALANYPTFEPSNLQNEDEFEKESSHRKLTDKRNLAIAQNYEPGSVMKPFTISSAVDLKLVNPGTTFEDKGPVTYSTHVIDNWDGKHHRTQTIVQLLQKSNNIGAAWVGTMVGSRNLYDYLEKFGFKDKTGITLEGEDSGILRDDDSWTAIDTANISFGQGISTTPLQILNAFNVFANGGFLVQPKIISEIYDGDKTIEIPTKTVRRVLSKETAETMNSMLEKAAEGGEAKFFILKNYKIAGKTGTAQIPEKGSYSKDRTNATFVGYLSTNRDFSMIVKLEEPRPKVFASETAVPLWMEICSELVKFYGIPPDKEIVS